MDSFLLGVITSVDFFKKNVGKHQPPFVRPLMPLFWTSGDIYSGFQSQGGSPDLHVLSPACNGILRFTSDVTPADLLVSSMAAKPF